jgi:hypothetical protein
VARGAPEDRYEVLVESLTELVSLLGELGEDGWAEQAAAGLRLIEAGDGHGLDRVAALCGGMGSLNDLVIDPANQHPIAEEHAEEVNRRLGSLRSTIYATARGLRRDLDRGR